jgi:hypothetical protein
MTYWLLVVWICAGPGQCVWELRGQYPTPEACDTAARTQNRFADCLKAIVPVPGTPR